MKTACHLEAVTHRPTQCSTQRRSAWELGHGLRKEGETVRSDAGGLESTDKTAGRSRAMRCVLTGPKIPADIVPAQLAGPEVGGWVPSLLRSSCFDTCLP